MPDAKDYYVILGVHRDATAVSIKSAYRKLARTHHPDFVSHLGDGERAEASLRMAELNEAYDVLSNLEARRDYDQHRLRVVDGLTDEPVRPPAEFDVGPIGFDIHDQSRRPSRATGAVTSSVVTAFAKRTFRELLESRKGLAWKRANQDGFDWGAVASAWPSRYSACLRAVEVLDPGVTERFVERADALLKSSKRLVGKDYLLLILAFYRLEEPDQVTAMCRRFRDAAVRSKDHDVELHLALVDVVHARTLPCGAPPADPRFTEALRVLGLARTSA